MRSGQPSRPVVADPCLLPAIGMLVDDVPAMKVEKLSAFTLLPLMLTRPIPKSSYSLIHGYCKISVAEMEDVEVTMAQDISRGYATLQIPNR